MNHDLKPSAKPSGEVKETSRYKINPADGKLDAKSQREDQGWIKMDVRWAVSDATFNSEFTVIGRTVLLPGIGAKHDIHRHPNAEEWEYCIYGVGIKHIGDESFYLRPGELAFHPRNIYHGLENASATEPLITLWGYCGVSSLEKAGYATPGDDAKIAAHNH
jgi:quercetin dioxygenase-like cupin family protein